MYFHLPPAGRDDSYRTCQYINQSSSKRAKLLMWGRYEGTTRIHITRNVVRSGCYICCAPRSRGAMSGQQDALSNCYFKPLINFDRMANMSSRSGFEESFRVPERRNSDKVSTRSRAVLTVSQPFPTETRHREDEIPSSIDLNRARLLRIDHEEAQLAAHGCTWYEIKATTLRESDIPVIKVKTGISELYEVTVPRVEARAHHPHTGFHTFYVNQIDRGLRFPIPKFISSLCDHLEVSPSQLTLNSFSSLLSLGISLKFYRVPISTYTLMQLIQIKRLGPGKFYISNKKELGFIGGNPSSHKGWMSRYFFIKRISSRENPWDCNMSWRDNAHTLSPSIPEQRPGLTKFLEGGERRKKRRPEEKTKEPAHATVSKGSTSEPWGTADKAPEQQFTEAPYVLLDTSAISFVANPSGSISLDFVRRLVPDQDFDLGLRLVEQVKICLQLVVESLVSNACDWTSHDWVDQTMSYQLIQTTSFAMHPRLIEYNAVALDWMYCIFLLVILSQRASADLAFLLVLCKSKTPSFLLNQAMSFCNPNLAKHAIHQVLAPAGHCHRKILLLILYNDVAFFTVTFAGVSFLINIAHQLSTAS
ncbi:hypothetical protein F511_28014 [Dorcoceras hygrometricum]|uniref:Uncharacterized protein n=1 Tax=Dorcoceras hygrometricum TaxID=472368 RepID=A0A2Z7BK60_9LAMI|nr:hypothetical protein F511_28014 [Dorcoceras hygrometricum]